MHPFPGKISENADPPPLHPTAPLIIVYFATELSEKATVQDTCL